MEDKLNILYSSGMIQKEVKEYCMIMMNHLTSLGFHREEDYDMLITHLSMAMERIRKQEEMSCLSEEIWKQVVSNAWFGKATTLFEQFIANSPYPIPESEKQYLMMHLCALLEKQEERK